MRLTEQRAVLASVTLEEAVSLSADVGLTFEITAWRDDEGVLDGVTDGHGEELERLGDLAKSEKDKATLTVRRKEWPISLHIQDAPPDEWEARSEHSGLDMELTGSISSLRAALSNLKSVITIKATVCVDSEQIMELIARIGAPVLLSTQPEQLDLLHDTMSAMVRPLGPGGSVTISTADSAVVIDQETVSKMRKRSKR